MSGTSITIYESDILNWAVQQNLIDSKQAPPLWNALQQQYNERWKLSWVHLAYFFGGFLIVGSMTWFTSLAWQDASGVSLFLLSVAYVASFAYAGWKFWNNQSNIPTIVGGIFATVAVCIVPVSVYALQKMFDFWPINVPYLAQELSMVISGAIAVYYIRFPFLTAPITFALFSITENDLTFLIFGKDATSAEHFTVSVVFGLIIIGCSYYVDSLKLPQDFAFWGYLFGVFAFWGGLSALYHVTFHQTGPFQYVYLLSNVLLMMLSVQLQRNVFLVFGGLGSTYVIADFLFTEATLEQNSYISIIFGSILIGAGYRYSNSNNNTFASWAYFFGVIIFWGGITTLYYEVYPSMTYKFIYFLINAGLMTATIWVKYYVFLVFGTIGVMNYIGDLVYTYYWNSYYLPFILTVIGLVFIAIAIYFSRTHLKKEQMRQQSSVVLNLPQQEVQMALLGPGNNVTPANYLPFTYYAAPPPPAVYA